MQIPNIPRLYTALAEWCACLLFVFFCPKRFNKKITVLISAIALIVICAFHYVAGKLHIVLWIPGMVMAFVLMNAFLFSTCRINVKATCYWTAQAFIIAEFIAAMEWWLNYFFVTSFSVLQAKWFEVALVVFIYAIAFVGLFFINRRYQKITVAGVGKSDVISVLIIAVSVFAMSNISFVFDLTPFSSQYPLEIFYTRTLVDFCGVLILFAVREQRLSNLIKDELFHIRNLLERQYAQYCVTSETIDTINRKYHDLKHYLNVFRTEYGVNEAGEKFIKKIEDETYVFDMIYNTGNKVLDTVLTSKAILCTQKGIDFNCMADGNAISFLSDMDICSIFGNALDNAIESVSCIKNKAEGLIELRVFKQDDFLVIKCENNFEHELIRHSGTLLTTKKDKSNHGYGIKSIKFAVENYGGRVKFYTKDTWFTLCIVIPLEQNKK